MKEKIKEFLAIKDEIKSLKARQDELMQDIIEEHPQDQIFDINDSTYTVNTNRRKTMVGWDFDKMLAIVDKDLIQPAIKYTLDVKQAKEICKGIGLKWKMIEDCKITQEGNLTLSIRKTKQEG